MDENASVWLILLKGFFWSVNQEDWEGFWL